MTKIDFHFHIKNKLEYVCCLLRKAVTRVPVVIVVAKQPALSQLEQQLWQFSDTAFIGHAWVHQHRDTPVDRSMAQCARVLLSDTIQPCTVPKAVLLNLTDTVTGGFEQYERLIEIVSNDEHDKLQARARWRHYAQRGYPIAPHSPLR